MHIQKGAIQQFGINNISGHDAEWGTDFKEISLQYIKDPEIVLDIGCGHGVAIHAISALLPMSNFIGIDPGAESVNMASDEGRETNAIN